MSDPTPTGSRHRALRPKFLEGNPKGLAILVGGSATALVLVVAAFAWYLITGKPISQLPRTILTTVIDASTELVVRAKKWEHQHKTKADKQVHARVK